MSHRLGLLRPLVVCVAAGSILGFVGCGGAQKAAAGGTSGGGSVGTDAASGDEDLHFTTAEGARAPAHIVAGDGRYIGVVRMSRQPKKIGVVAVDAQGKKLWRTDGVCGKVFRVYALGGRVVCFNGAMDTVIALDAATGDVAWKKSLGGRITRTRPRDGLIVVGLGGEDVVLQPADGNEVTRTPTAKATQLPVRMGGALATFPRPGIMVTRQAGTKALIRTDLAAWLPGHAAVAAGLAVFGDDGRGGVVGLMDGSSHKLLWSARWNGQQPTRTAVQSGAVLTFTGRDAWMAVNATNGRVLGSGKRSRRQPVVASGRSVARFDSTPTGMRLSVSSLKPMNALAGRPPALSPWFDRGATMQFMTVEHGGISAKSGLFKKAKAGAMAVRVRKLGKDITLAWERGNGADTGTIVVVAEARAGARKHGDRFRVNVGVVAASDRTSMVLSRAVFDEARKTGRSAWVDIDAPGATELVYVGPTQHGYTLRRHGKGKQARVLNGHAFTAGAARYVVVESNGVPVIVRAVRPGKVLFLAEIVPP